MLSGKYLDGPDGKGRYGKSDPGGRLKQLPRQKLVRLKSLAEKNGMSMAGLSLSWVASQPGVTSPIIGARSEKQLEESAGACETRLSEKLMKQIDAIFEPGTHHVNYYTANFGPGERPR
jgi:aryl-alcohol dehydrogenase-like predicted oxidoreductase